MYTLTGTNVKVGGCDGGCGWADTGSVACILLLVCPETRLSYRSRIERKIHVTAPVNPGYMHTCPGKVKATDMIFTTSTTECRMVYQNYIKLNILGRFPT